MTTDTTQQVYNPYSVNFFPNDRFEILYKDKTIVAEGRQREVEMTKGTVDLLNAAFTFGVNDVRAQLDPILKQYKEDMDELVAANARLGLDATKAINQYYELLNQRNQETNNQQAQALFEPTPSAEQPEAEASGDAEPEQTDKPRSAKKTAKKKGK